MSGIHEISGIRQIAVNVQDLERAKEFYRDILGLAFLFDAPPGMSFFDCGGVRLLLGKAQKPEFDHPASIIYYKVSDINASFKKLRNRGVKFLAEPHMVHKAEDHDLYMAFLNDSEGNVLSIIEERAS